MSVTQAGTTRTGSVARWGVIASAVQRPKIIGSARMGSSLSVDTSMLTNVSGYQWMADGMQIIGETGPSYSAPAAGQNISCIVTCAEGDLETPPLRIHMAHADAAHTQMDDAVLELIPHTDVTHSAIADGTWSDPETWDVGEVPGAGAVVLIPIGQVVTYDVASSPRLDRIRVDGTLSWAMDHTTDLLVETLVGTQGSALIVGQSIAERLPAAHIAEIRFSNRAYRIDPLSATDIDIARDPSLLGRGLVSLGQVIMFGAQRTHALRTEVDGAPMAGAMSLVLAEQPTNWQVGDTVVIPGTRFRLNNGTSIREDEERVIAAINGKTISWTDPLLYDHDHHNSEQTDTSDKQPHIAHLTRNIIIRSETSTDLVHRRGHTMFMHMMAEPDIWGVEFRDLGRTDKTRPAGVRNGVDFTYVEPGQSGTLTTVPMTADANLQSRYEVHFHRVGFLNAKKAKLVDCVIRNAPGWNVVHHDCEVEIDRNVVYGFTGAGIVSESGNEIGSWNDNVVIGCINPGGISNTHPKNAEFAQGLWGDFARTGYGMFFRGRALVSNRNAVYGASFAYVFYHRSNNNGIAPTQRLLRDHVDLGDLTKIYSSSGSVIDVEDYPIIHHSDNFAMGCNEAIFVAKNGAAQYHDININIQNLTAVAVEYGGEVQYVGNYALTNWKCYSIDTQNNDLGGRERGIIIGRNAVQVAIVNAHCEGFARPYYIKLDSGQADPDTFNNTNNPMFMVIDCTDANSVVPGVSFEDLTNAQVTSAPADVTFVGASTALPGSLTSYPTINTPFIMGEWTGSAVNVTGSGTKTTSLGTSPFPKSWDDIGIDLGSDWFASPQYQNYAAAEGYWEYDDNGETINIVVIPVHASDQVSALTVKHMVAIKCTGNMSAYTLNGTWVPSAVAPTRATLIETVAAGSSVIIEPLIGATSEPGTTLKLDRDFLAPQNGYLDRNLDTGQLTYTPHDRYTGPDVFWQYLHDGRGGYVTVQVDIAVT